MAGWSPLHDRGYRRAADHHHSPAASVQHCILVVHRQDRAGGRSDCSEGAFQPYSRKGSNRRKLDVASTLVVIQVVLVMSPQRMFVKSKFGSK